MEPLARIPLFDTKPSRVRCSGRAARCWRFLICEESPELHRPCPNQTSSWRWPVPAGPPQLPFDLERRAGAPTATNTAETTPAQSVIVERGIRGLLFHYPSPLPPGLLFLWCCQRKRPQVFAIKDFSNQVFENEGFSRARQNLFL